MFKINFVCVSLGEKNVLSVSYARLCIHKIHTLRLMHTLTLADFNGKKKPHTITAYVIKELM